ncbi:hypothetical protein C0995_009325 [Termitomyces sp. Mi166|nr:hypothetical protein C0995_009325 [Termitomyces sp. Mi166\
MAVKPYPTRQLGKNGPAVSAIGLGAMGMGAFYGKSDDKQSLDTLTYAADRGVTFWDTSDAYGHSQDLIGQWFTTTGRRSEIFLATKFGARDPESGSFQPNSKPSYIVKALKRSLEKLKTDYIDLYYQHRVDPDVPIEIVLETLRPFVEKGQVKWIGLSECSIATLKRAKAVPGIGEKVVAAQMEFSPFELYLEKTGFVDAANEVGIAVVAYSPLARGMVTGRFEGPTSRNRFKSPADFSEDDFRRNMPRFSEENFPKNLKIVDELKKFADKLGPVVPIPGIRTVERLEENARGAEIALEPDDVKAIRSVVESAEVMGERYQAEFMPQGDCVASM